MEAACIRQTEIPHASRLFTDFSYHFDRVSRFYAHRPRDPESVRAAAASIDYPDDRREALVRALRRQNGDSSGLNLLAQRGTVAVVTGQQVGLFSGPAYTMYKALTAAKVAAQLTEQGIPAVPVFWLATEDHDLAEVDHCWAFGPDHQPVGLKSEAAADGQRPVGQIALDSIPTAGLRQLLAEFPFGDRISGIVEAAYRPGATLGDAFRSLMEALLGKFGLVYLDPLAEDIRAIGAPFLREAVAHAAELKSAILQRSQELHEAGYHAQVHVEPQTSLFFVLEKGRRISLKSQNGSYVSREGRYTPEQLAGAAEHLSPNALLRPVMQDYLLPTVMYIGGPAELAYLAQSEVLYKRLLGRMPVAEHRASFTILDARAAKLMDRYRLNWAEIYGGEAAVVDAIADRLVPPTLRRTFEESTKEVESALFRIGRDLSQFDPTLVAALERSRSKILYQIAKIEKKSGREALRREARSEADAHFLAGLLFPNKHLQERLYSILPFLAKHGPELLDTIHDAINVDCPDHRVLVV